MGFTGTRKFDARPDGLDFRDQMYSPSLVEVSEQIDVDSYREVGVPVLDQEAEGSCTGFGLATVGNYLLRKRESFPDETPVSQRMLYEMARRYDEWAGEDYEGSSARGAIKGWHKHGVCSASSWRYTPGRPGRLNERRAANAAERPLGAYYRVNHSDLVAMHAAITEVGILYATAVVHKGWLEPDNQGRIEPRMPDTPLLGGHAFALVAYDENGFWVQNSWGEDWALGGLALVTYEDWLTSATDVWVARLGVPVTVGAEGQSVADFTDEHQPHALTFNEMRPHVITIGNEGRPYDSGTYAITARDIRSFGDRFIEATESWPTRRLAIYAHGGLVPASSAISHAARLRTLMLENQIYPLFFIWNTDWLSVLKNMIGDVLSRWRAEQPAMGIGDFLADRLDDLIEQMARATIIARAGWDEIIENGVRSTSVRGGAARILADYLATIPGDKPLEVHLIGHSAGSIILAPLAQYLGSRGRIAQGPLAGTSGLGVPVESCTLWAPAATIRLAADTYFPSLESGQLKRMSVFVLNDGAERDDNAGPYQKSILYLVSNALSETPRVPLLHPDGEPILGMAKFIERNKRAKNLVNDGLIRLSVTPTGGRGPSPLRSDSTSHVGFSSDRTTHVSTLAGILGGEPIDTATTSGVDGLERQLADEQMRVQ